MIEKNLFATSKTVSIICLCYNQVRFVEAALQSVAAQTYEAIELIIVDDGSTDGSQAVIENWLAHHQRTFVRQVVWLPLSQNLGNCKAFNLGLSHATGQFVMDLAADDVLVPACIATQVAKFDNFENLGKNCGVVFSNALFINEIGQPLHLHHQPKTMQKYEQPYDIYADILTHSFICTPTMLSRKEVFDTLQGYDETLSYEDFDFWVRSARHYAYAYADEVLVHKRKVAHSLGTKFYGKEAFPFLESTLTVCQKAYAQQQNATEGKALCHRLRYHIRLCCYTSNYDLVPIYLQLLQKITPLTWQDQCWRWAAKCKIPLQRLYGWYQLK